jgi:hypothetical protein
MAALEHLEWEDSIPTVWRYLDLLIAAYLVGERAY